MMELLGTMMMKYMIQQKVGLSNHLQITSQINQFSQIRKFSQMSHIQLISQMSHIQLISPINQIRKFSQFSQISHIQLTSQIKQLSQFNKLWMFSQISQFIQAQDLANWSIHPILIQELLPTFTIQNNIIIQKRPMIMRKVTHF